jgi:GYF domain 2
MAQFLRNRLLTRHGRRHKPERATMSLAAFANEALDGTWRVNVSGQVYGPYTGHQIRAFAAEGRIAPHSVVRTGEQGPWITAIDDPVLAQLFVKAKSDRSLPAVADTAAGTAYANLVVIADLRSGSAMFETTLGRLGDAYRVSSQAWLLHTDCTVGTVRNELVQHLGSLDGLFIVDASRGGKSAWFNFGPEADAKIRKVWRRSA